MRFMAEYPLNSSADGGRWTQPETVGAFAQDLERLGFDAVAFTDHPAPSAKWLRAGGHETFDPYAALTFCAAVTTTVTLMTHLSVVPYRNPFLHARSMMTLDVLSRGRSVFVLGTGYLRSEFAALGVEFDERNALFDEAVEVIRALWTSEEVEATGLHFRAPGQTLMPRPVQPSPHLWLGGNSRAALERLARWGSGWSAMVAAPQLSVTARTPNIEDPASMSRVVARLEEDLARHGRTVDEVDIMVTPPATDLASAASQAERLDGLAEWIDAGVTWFGVVVPPRSRHETADLLDRFAAGVMDPLRSVGRASPSRADGAP